VPPSAPKRSGLASLTSLGDLVARYPGRPGVPASRALTITPTLSELENRFLSLLAAENLPRPLVNAEIQLPRGRKAEPDFTWRDHRLIVELDGYETHATRQAFERDRARDRALQSAGWRVLRITWRQLHDTPSDIAAELRTVLT
jgi:very-short-patch-repair endonuclease